MIPLKIQLKNFLSYGDGWTIVDFTPYHFICLSGKNGHGKSALLDAITWALWGQARKTAGVARSDEALVRLGQRHMAVMVEFMCHNQRYMVRRECVICQDKTKLTLDFAVFESAAGDPVTKLRPLTEKTARLTQERIQDVVGLDFDSFTNSVFLRQGQSNEFSKKTAQERKQILTTILGLDQYEQLRKKALEKIRELETKKTATTQLCQYAQAECVRMADVPTKLALCQATCAQLGEAGQVLVARKQTIQERKKLVQVRTSELVQVQTELEQAQRELQVYMHAQQLESLQMQQTREVASAACVADLRALTEKRDMCAARVTHLTNVIAEHNQHIDTCKNFVVNSKKIAPAYEHTTVRFEKRKELYQRMIAHGNWVHSERTSIKQQQALVHAQDCSVCPLCRQTLKGNFQERVCVRLENHAHFYAARMIRLEKFIRESKQILAQENETIKQCESTLQQSAQAQVRMLELEERKKQLTDELEKVQIEYGAVDAQYQKVLVQKNELDNEHERIKTYLADRVKTDLRHCEHERTITELSEKKKKLSIWCDAQALELEHEERLCEMALGELSIQKNTALQEQGRLLQESAQLVRAHDVLKEHQNVLEKITCEIVDYEIIAQALGKDGVQALLIESVIPELEEEANDILSKLSDQQARVFIESVRDLKTGGTRETLDIKIADSAGIRPYELFSGGEAFRIDFALRIAISKLLARRAGASLQTLIIDEGFGSQDEDGLSLIVDMLYKIQDYFAKVIVVSHLPFLKDQVPVQFVVEKRASGSAVTVIEQMS